MANVNPVDLSQKQLDPNALINNPTRSLGPIVRSGTITPGTQYGEFARAIWVGSAGNISVIKWDGTTQVYTNVPVGRFWVASIGVNTSGTTASNLVWES